MFGSIVDEIKRLLVHSITRFISSRGIEVTELASPFQRLIQDGVLGVARMYPSALRRYPFVVVNNISGAEYILGFGRNRLGVDGVTTLQSGLEPFNLSAGRAFVTIRNEGVSHTLDAFPVLFGTPSSVSAGELVNVFRPQLPTDWWVESVGGRVLLRIESRRVTVQAASPVLGFPLGEFEPPDFRLVTGVGETCVASIEIGAESELTRTQLTDLIMFWGEWFRTDLLWLENEPRRLEIFLGGNIRRGGESEMSFGEGDLLHWIYLNRVDLPLQVFTYEQSTVLDRNISISRLM